MSELTVGTISGLAANGYIVDVAAGSQLTQPGMVLQVVSTTKTDTWSASVAQNTFADVTGLSATMATSSSANKVLVTVSLGYIHHSGGYNVGGSRVTVDGTVAVVGDQGGAGQFSVTAGGVTYGTSLATYIGQTYSYSYIYEPGDTNSHTYQVQLGNSETNTYTLYLNRNTRDSASDTRAVSTITLMEIAQ